MGNQNVVLLNFCVKLLTRSLPLCAFVCVRVCLCLCLPVHQLSFRFALFVDGYLAFDVSCIASLIVIESPSDTRHGSNSEVK